MCTSRACLLSCSLVFNLFTHCSTCNLASQYLEVEFSRQLRAHGYTSRIIDVLKDCLQFPVREREERVRHERWWGWCGKVIRWKQVRKLWEFVKIVESLLENSVILREGGV